MNRINNIVLNFNVNLAEIEDNLSKYISDKCTDYLIDKVYEGYLINDILTYHILKDKKINLNGSVSLKVVCKCKITDPILDSIIDVEINDINKMGYSYKQNCLCIFIPIHMCNKIYTLNQTIKVKIIGKRIEEDIVCIGEPV